MIWYLAKLPFTLSWNLLILGVYTLQLLWRVRRVLWDPRTWLTVGVFYVFSNLFLLFFQVGLDLFLLILVGKTLTDFLPDLGNYISNYGLSSAITILLFTTLATWPVEKFTSPGVHLRIFRKDVMEEIVRYNKEFVLSRLKRGVFIVLVGLLLGWWLGW